MQLFWVFLLATTFVVFSNGATLELYSDQDYYGDIPYSSNGGSCVNLFSWYQKKLSSVRAGDTCVIFYDGSGCTGKSFKIDREDVPQIFMLEGQGTHEDFDDRAVSFKLCDQAEGGNEVTLEIYNQTNYADEPLLRFENMCTCAAISEEFLNFSSIDNHHHCVTLFTSNNCNTDEEHEIIFPGKSDVTADLSKTMIFGKVRSLKPCEVPKQCFQMKAALTEIQVVDNNVGLFAAAGSGFMSMNAKTVFFNNGSATVSQEYSATKLVRQVIEVQKMTYNSRIEQWGHSESSYLGVDIGLSIPIGPVPLNIGVHLGKAVKDSYTEINENSEQNSETHISETSVEFSVRQRIEVPPCQTYSVDSMIRIIDNYPMEYKSYFKLEGTKNGDNRMTADDLIAELNSMKEYTYNYTVDEFTVVAYSTNQISTSFGAETEIIGEGGRVPGCFMQ